MLAVIGCGGDRRGALPVPPAAAPAPTVSERMIAMLPQGAQVIIEVDLARLRASPVVGDVVTRALAARTAELAGVPASPLAIADQIVLAAYGVGTAQAATVTVLASPRELPGATKLADGFYAVGPPDWVDQAQQRVALASTGEIKFALTADPEMLALRRHAMPDKAPGASVRLTARLPFDARISLARQTGLDAAPAQVSAWADVADDAALIVDCDAADPGDRRPDERRSDAAKRLEATLRGALAAVADQPAIRLLGLPSSFAGAKLVTRGSWVRAIVAIGPLHLQRIVERAAVLLRELPAVPTPAPPTPRAEPPAAAPTEPHAAVPRGDHSS